MPKILTTGMVRLANASINIQLSTSSKVLGSGIISNDSPFPVILADPPSLRRVSGLKDQCIPRVVPKPFNFSSSVGFAFL